MTPLFTIGYNTNGLAHHRILDALRLLGDLGYEGVAITPDVGALDPTALDDAQVEDVAHWSRELGLELAIETGARYLLDARRKHFPSLLEEDTFDRKRRIGFLTRSVDLAARLEAGLVSLWSGSLPERLASGDPELSVERREVAFERLANGLREVLDYAHQRGVQLAFEPEPGMFIERPGEYGELLERMGSDADELGLCLDVGHLLVTGDLPVARQIREWAPRLVHVHLDDIRDGVHEHRMFGTGDLDLTETLNALMEVGYGGMAAVELSRDSHRGPQAAEAALGHVRRAISDVG